MEALPSSFSSCAWLRYCNIFSCSRRISSLLLKPSFSKREESLCNSSRLSSISAIFLCSSKASSFKIQSFTTERLFSTDSSSSFFSLSASSTTAFSTTASSGANAFGDFSTENCASSDSKRERLLRVFITSPKRPE